MSAVIQPIFAPDAAAMRQHLEHMFGGFLDGFHNGLIELSWTDSQPDDSGRHRLKNARLFQTDQLDDLIEQAVKLNSTPMCNVYIGAALRKPDTAPFGRASDDDAWALTCVYADLDEPEAAAGALQVYGAMKPTLVVVTGRQPHTRAQLWWRLDEPLTDHGDWEALLRGMAVKLGADTTVSNPSRVMRLAGTIAWPIKQGRTTELTNIVPLVTPGQSEYGYTQMVGLFPPVAQSVQHSHIDSTTYGTNSLGLLHKVKDGREGYMRSTILACLAEYIGENGAEPTPQELFDTAWPQYERNTDFSRPGRGREEFMAKCVYTLARFKRGDIRGMDSLDHVIESYKRRTKPAPTVAETITAQQANPDIYETLSLTDISNLPPPTWLVEGLIPETGLTFIYGKPGKGKSFITLDLALRIAHGLDWHGKGCKQGGVLYIAGEGKGGYRNRVKGWHQYHQLTPDNASFRLLPRAVNFMTPDDVAKLVRTVKAAIGDARLIIIDTVARVLPGAEENASKEMGLFVAACDAIRDTCGVAVIGVHHAGKDEDRGMRGSTALEGAGDCVLHLKRGEDSMAVEVLTEKQKDGEEAAPLVLEFKKVEWMDGLKAASTLVPTSATTRQNATKTSSLDKATCRAILAEIKRAWDAGEPWSNEPRTQNDGRYLPRWICRETGCTRAEAKFLVEEWMMNKIITVEIYSTKHKLRGIKQLSGID